MNKSKQTVFGHLAAIAALIAFFAGCDSFYDYRFQITNLTGDTIRVELRQNNSSNYKNDTVVPGQTTVIFREGGACRPDYVPEDKYGSYPGNILPPRSKVTIYVGDILMPDSLRYHKRWDYSSQKLLGVYTLNITEELVFTLKY